MSPPSERQDRAALLFVVLVSLAMTWGAIAFIYTFGWDFPLQDDLEYGLVAGPDRSLSWRWVWSPHMEHRIPLARLLLLPLLRLTHDFRSGMVAEVVLLALVTFGAVATARRLRGSTRYTDAVFPLLLLHTGNAENLLMAHQLSLMLPVALTCTILFLALSERELPTGGRLAALAACVLALPLNGGHGLVQMPVWIAWLGGFGLVRVLRGGPTERRWGGLMLAVAGLGVAEMALYFVGYESPPGRGYETPLAEAWNVAMAFLALSFGPGAEPAWPWTAWVVSSIWVATLALLVVTVRRAPAERGRALAVAAQLAAVAGMAVGVAVGRGAEGFAAGFALRYVILPTPALIAAYLAWTAFAPREPGRFVRFLMFALASSTLFYNVDAGARYGQRRFDAGERFELDVLVGVPLEELAHRHSHDFYAPPEAFLARLEWLKESGLPPFRPGIRDGTPRPPRPFHMMQLAPVQAPPEEGLRTRRIGGRAVLMVEAPGELRFEVPPDAEHLFGRYGVLRQLWTPEATDGLRFRVLLATSEEETELFARELRPERADDGKLHRLLVELPSAEGEVVLRVERLGEPGPVDWGGWTQVGFLTGRR